MGGGGGGMCVTTTTSYLSLLHCSCLLSHTLLYLCDLVPVVGMVRIVGLQKVELCVPSLIDTYAIFKLQPYMSFIFSKNAMSMTLETLTIASHKVGSLINDI